MGISPSEMYSAFCSSTSSCSYGGHFLRPSASRKPHVDILLSAEFGKRRSYQFMNKNVDNDYFELKHVGAAYMNSAVIK
jgi:hypothetical protein